MKYILIFLIAYCLSFCAFSQQENFSTISTKYLYYKVYNPVEILYSDVTVGEIRLQSEKCQIIKENNRFMIMPLVMDIVEIIVFHENTIIDELNFFVKKLPNLEIKLEKTTEINRFDQPFTLKENIQASLGYSLSIDSIRIRTYTRSGDTLLFTKNISGNNPWLDSDVGKLRRGDLLMVNAVLIRRTDPWGNVEIFWSDVYYKIRLL